MTATAEEQLAFAGPGALAELVRARLLTPRELVELCLRRIGALDPRTVADSALMLDAMHGAIAADADVLPRFSGRYVDAAAASPGRLRIAVSRKPPPGLIARVSVEQRGAWDRTVALLAELGHHVVERDPAYGLTQLEFLQTWLRGIYEDARAVPDQSRLERLTRQVAGAGALFVRPRRRERLLPSVRRAPRGSSRCGTRSTCC